MTKNNRQVKVRMPLTEARKALFLKVLAETGVYRWAARAASPHSTSMTGSAATFRLAAQRDPAFAAAIEEARADADARLEHECYRRAVEGVEQGVFQKGVQAVDFEGKPAKVRVYSDRLLERLLQARMPARFSDKRQVEISGHVTRSALTLEPSDLNYLTAAERSALASILTKIARGRGELPADDQDDATEIIDVTPDAAAIGGPEAEQLAGLW